MLVTVSVRESEESRDRLENHLNTMANIASLLEADGTDPRTMLARRQKIVDRYLEEVRDDPWDPDEGKAQA